jgi:hypothetical protein
MNSIRSLRDLMEKEGNLDIVRAAIADLIAEKLRCAKAANQTAALPHLINAIGSFTLGINATRQPLKFGLYACLGDLEKICAAVDGNEKWNPLFAKGSELMTFDFLIEAFQTIRDQASPASTHGNQRANNANRLDDTSNTYRNRDSQSDSGNSKCLA